MIPGLYDVARLAELEGGEERWMLETKVVRDRNRVADALAGCDRDHQDALARLTERPGRERLQPDTRAQAAERI